MSFFALIDLIQRGHPPVNNPWYIPDEQFADEVLQIHNAYRKKHQAYPLRLSSELTALAQSWADYLKTAPDLAHSGHKLRGTRIGENVSMKWAPDKALYKADEICAQWYSECRNHDYKSEPLVLTTGHFTQMVWRNSTEMGVGRSHTKDGRSIVVVNYFPPGNVIGEFGMNVLMPLPDHLTVKRPSTSPSETPKITSFS